MLPGQRCSELKYDFRTMKINWEKTRIDGAGIGFK